MKTTLLPLNDPDLTQTDLEAVMRGPAVAADLRRTVVEAFEEEFAQYLGRKHAIAVSSGTLGLLLIASRARRSEPGDEVVASAHSFRETTHAIALAAPGRSSPISTIGRARSPRKRRAAGVTEKTRAIVAAQHQRPSGALGRVACSSPTRGKSR